MNAINKLQSRKLPQPSSGNSKEQWANNVAHLNPSPCVLSNKEVASCGTAFAAWHRALFDKLSLIRYTTQPRNQHCIRAHESMDAVTWCKALDVRS